MKHDDGSDDFVRLREAALAATPGYLGGPGARARLIAFYERARALDLTHVRIGRGGPVVRGGDAIAQVVIFRDPEAWFGGPVVIAFVDREPGDAGALAPILAALDRHAARLGDDTLIEIRADDGPLLAELALRGFGIDSVIQLGDPVRALDALTGGSTPPAPATRLAEAGLALVPLAARHADPVVALHREVFSAEPDWCWFGAYPSHLRRLRDHLLRDREGQFAIVDRRDLVVGHLGAELDRDNPYWGPVGGLELVLAPDWRGRGLARALYLAALRSLVTRGARAIKGGTAQPGVLALGRVMGRPWHSFNLRRGTRFALEHFLAFAPDAVRRAHSHDDGG